MGPSTNPRIVLGSPGRTWVASVRMGRPGTDGCRQNARRPGQRREARHIARTEVPHAARSQTRAVPNVSARAKVVSAIAPASSSSTVSGRFNGRSHRLVAERCLGYGDAKKDEESVGEEGPHPGHQTGNQCRNNPSSPNCKNEHESPLPRHQVRCREFRNR
jgi:hypothetical protein